MFAFRVAITIANILLILTILTQVEVEDRTSIAVACFLELVFICNTILIWK